MNNFGTEQRRNKLTKQESPTQNRLPFANFVTVLLFRIYNCVKIEEKQLIPDCEDSLKLLFKSHRLILQYMSLLYDPLTF